MDSFIGEIRILPYTFPPLDWAYCNGMLISVQQNQALYSIIGNTYGGTPNQNFNLPNMASSTGNPGAAPMGSGSGPGLTPRALQQASVGARTATVNTNQMPQHNHTLSGQSGANADIVADPTNNYLCHGEVISVPTAFSTYAPYDAAHMTPLKNALNAAGTGQAHENRQPFLPMNFCICLYGLYPVRP